MRGGSAKRAAILRAARLRAMSEEVLRSVRTFLPPEVQLLDAVMGVPSRWDGHNEGRARVRARAGAGAGAGTESTALAGVGGWGLGQVVDLRAESWSGSK